MADTYYDVNGQPLKAKEPTYYDVNGSPVKSGGVIKPPSNADIFYQHVGRFIPSTLPAVGAMAGPEGAGIGSAAGVLLKNNFPSLFGSFEGGPADVPLEMGKDVITNSVLPALGGRIASGLVNTGAAATQQGLPGIVSKFKSISPTIKLAREADRVATNAGNLESKFMQPAELSTLPESNYPSGAPRGSGGKFQQNPASFAQAFNRELTAGQQEVTDLIHTGYSPTSGALDPTKILDTLAKNPKQYSNIDPITKNNLREFLTTVKEQKPFANTNENAFLRYAKNRLIFDLPSIATGAITGHAGAGLAAAGTIELGEMGIKKLMSDPQFAQLVIQAAKTPASSPAAPLIGKSILYGLRGTSAYLNTPEGRKEEIQISPNGEPQYLPRQ